jgi:hypothetical protein
VEISPSTYYYAAREVDYLFFFEHQSLQRLKVNSELVPDNAYDDELMLHTEHQCFGSIQYLGVRGEFVQPAPSSRVSSPYLE